MLAPVPDRLLRSIATSWFRAFTPRPFIKLHTTSRRFCELDPEISHTHG